MSFYFKGALLGSKSLLNRALILKSYDDRLRIHGDSDSDDVQILIRCLESFKAHKKDFELGLGATTFRFFSLRLSREPGRYQLRIPKELSTRPQNELLSILTQLGVFCEFQNQVLSMESQSGWLCPKNHKIHVDVSSSSQFLSSLVLNAWDLDFDLNIELIHHEKWVSESYFKMTCELCKKMGMEILDNGQHSYVIPKKQKLRFFDYTVEPDLSSAFAIAALTAFGGEVILERFPTTSLQPDVVFLTLLKKLGFDVETNKHDELRVTKKSLDELHPIEVNLKDSPDLFPSLAVMAGFAKGRSRFYGAQHLRFKETDRIHEVSRLLDLLGVEHKILEDGMEVFGNPDLKGTQDIIFDVSRDHRLAMAGALAHFRFPNLNLIGKDSVNKSFPQFWNVFDQGLLR